MISHDRSRLFLTAQDAVWDAVLTELNAGRKASHWMWFVFPQLAMLGRSEMARKFGIRDLKEAADYLAHPVLGDRLLVAATLVLEHSDCTAEEILGPVDAVKLRSCATLFGLVPASPDVFERLLEKFYAGQGCPLTIAAVATG